MIAIALVVDTFYAGHEALGLSFMHQYYDEWFPKLPREGRLNERRTRLEALIDQLRRHISQQEGLFTGADPIRLIIISMVDAKLVGRGEPALPWAVRM